MLVRWPFHGRLIAAPSGGVGRKSRTPQYQLITPLDKVCGSDFLAPLRVFKFFFCLENSKTQSISFFEEVL
jgi:hypothetical protein